MKPRIFLSSTIQDLRPIRDALRSTIEDLGYEPVMSEHGEVGYLPNLTAEDSCYATLEECDVVVAVIGKRYGSIGRDSKSITHNEVRRARDLEIPVYCFIDRDAARQLQVLEVNPEINIPGFEAPQALLEFVREVVAADRNNSIIEFSDVSDAQTRLRLQLASLFTNLLRQKRDVIQKSIAELLAEVRAIRYNLPPDKTEGSAALFAGVRFYLDTVIEQHELGAKWHYHRLVVAATKGFASSIIPLLKSRQLRVFLESVGVRVEIMTFAERKERKVPRPRTGIVLAAGNGPLLGSGSASDLHYILYPNLELWIDERVLRALERVHFDFRHLYTQIVRDAVHAGQSTSAETIDG